MMGISKRELLNDYFYDEFLLVLDEHNALNHFDPDAEAVEYVSAEDW